MSNLWNLCFPWFAATTNGRTADASLDPASVALRLLSANGMSEKDAVQLEMISDPLASAKAAGLRYVSDTKPGIQRIRRGDHFV